MIDNLPIIHSAAQPPYKWHTLIIRYTFTIEPISGNAELKWNQGNVDIQFTAGALSTRSPDNSF